MKISHEKNGRAGFSALEMMIAVMLLSLLAGSLTLVIQRMRSMATSTSVDAQLQDSAERAMKRISEDLARSGEIVMGGNAYPYLFEDGDATGAFVAHAHKIANHAAVLGDPDFGPTREIVFAQPMESDLPGSYGRNVPDIDANANLIWDPVEYSYVLVTGLDGVNRLQRCVNGADPITIASNVERVVFDDNASSGFVIPVQSVRVRLFFRKFDAHGVLHRYSAEQIIKLRNGV